MTSSRISYTRPQPRLSLHFVSLITEAGHHVTDTLVAYDADDAKKKARGMMRANHNETHVTILDARKA